MRLRLRLPPTTRSPSSVASSVWLLVPVLLRGAGELLVRGGDLCRRCCCTCSPSVCAAADGGTAGAGLPASRVLESHTYMRSTAGDSNRFAVCCAFANTERGDGCTAADADANRDSPRARRACTASYEAYADGDSVSLPPWPPLPPPGALLRGPDPSSPNATNSRHVRLPGRNCGGATSACGW